MTRVAFVMLGGTVESVRALVVREAPMAAACGISDGVIASVWLCAPSKVCCIAFAGPIRYALLTSAGLLGLVLGAAMLSSVRPGRITPAAALRIE